MVSTSSLQPLEMRLKTLIVGDVHGCSKELRRLVKKAKADSVVLVGDLFTKGPSPRGVWRQIRTGGWRAVLGNHDQRLLDVLDGKRKRDSLAEKCIKKLNKEGLEWQDWLRELPLFLTLDDQTMVVHAGVHPSGNREKTTKRMALTMRRWPLDSSHADFWYRQYRGPRCVIFGHDAARGRVRLQRDGRPLIIGLDSGCVYGGELSGYILEDDRIVKVAARKAYCPT